MTQEQQANPDLIAATLELDAARRGLNDVTLREEEASPAGANRVSIAVGRLLEACQLESAPIDRELDAGVISSLAENLRVLTSSPAWDSSKAFGLAHTIDSYTADRLRAYTDRNSDYASYPGRFEVGELYARARNGAEDAQIEERLRSSAATVEEIAENVKQAAGVVAEGKMSEAFSEYSNAEMSGADLYRHLALGVLTAVVAFSIYTAIELPSSLGSSLAHLGIGLSSLTAFGYLARESAQHRKAARWASVMSVQLRTLDAYSAEMAPEQRESLREHFGRRIFAEPLYASEGQEAKASDLTPLMQAAVDLVKVARGN